MSAHAGPDCAAARRLSQRLLDGVERAGNRLPDPVTIFAGLALLVLLASAAASALGVSVKHPVTGQTIAVVNLLSRDGLRQVLTGVVSSFTGFAPLGTVLTVVIGIGVAERTGLFAAILHALVAAVPRRAITPTIIFAGMLSHTASDAGYVVLVPLAPALFVSLGRHPLAGIAAAFAGIGGGFSANVLLAALDPMLAGITQEAARFLDPAYVVRPTANYFFLAASTLLLTPIGTFVTERIVEPRLGPWTGPRPIDALRPLDATQRRGLRIAGLAFGVALLGVLLLVLPANAPLRSPVDGGLGPFYDSLVGLLLLLFLAPGLAFGVAVGKLRSDRDAARMMAETIATMGSYIVMAFFAGQFIAWFRASQLGLILAVEGAESLRAIGLRGVPLMIAFVLVTALINLFMASASAKWTLMAPVFVPMLMTLGLSPEAALGLFRVGDSITNVITPLNYYLPSIILMIAREHLPEAGLGTIIATMLPYAIAFGLAWTAMIVTWIALGLPLGPGSPLHYPAG